MSSDDIDIAGSDSFGTHSYDKKRIKDILMSSKYEVSAVVETWRVIIGWIIQRWKQGGVLMKVENVDKRSKVIHIINAVVESHRV